MPRKMTFGQKLKKLRLDKKITIKKMSKDTKIPYDTLTSLMSRKDDASKIPTLPTTLTLAKYFNLSVEDLIKDVDFYK